MASILPPQALWVAAKETGRPGYDPADLLKLYVYGYINRVRSSRRLEAEAHRSIEVIWLLNPPQNHQIAKSTLDAMDAQILAALDSDARLSMTCL